MSKGLCVVITGSSGAGKTSVVRRLLKQIPGSARLITTTSRKPRPGEVEGVDYNFVSRQQFEKLVEQGKFLEWEENYGNLYGSERAVLEQMLEQHSVVLVTLDVRGAKSYKKVYPDAITLALAVPPDQIPERIIDRAPIDSVELERRVEAAVREQAEIEVFDFIVENQTGQLETKTVPRAKKVILNELTKRQSSVGA